MCFEIKDLQRQYGFSIIYVTHDQAEAMALSDRILVMRQGVAQQIDTALNIYTNPANKFVFSFIGLFNFLDVLVVGLAGNLRAVKFCRITCCHQRQCAANQNSAWLVDLWK